MIANPFLYPEAKHRRRLSPGPFSDYRTFKPYLREEFRGKCVYCRVPDGLMKPEGFCVEHYRPRKRFPELECAYTNLFYACNGCNNKKGIYWPSGEESAKGIVLLNPCDMVMSEHVRFRGATVMPRSKQGEFFIDWLQLNELRSVKYRSYLLALIKSHVEALRRLRLTRTQLARKQRKCKDSCESEELRLEIESVERQLLKGQETLLFVLGEAGLQPLPPNKG